MKRTLHAGLGLLALAVPVLAVACGSAPASEEQAETTSEAVTPIAPAGTCAYAGTTWATAEPYMVNPPPHNAGEWMVPNVPLWNELQESCRNAVGEVAFFPSDAGTDLAVGAFYAWCSPGTYPGTSNVTPGGCAPPGKLLGHMDGFTQLVVWAEPYTGNLPSGCRLVACSSN